MKYSFILEIDNISKDDIHELISVLANNHIKFHMLKSYKELKENLKYKARWENLKNWIKSLPINEDNFDIIPECIYNEYGKVGITKKAILEKMIDLEEKQSDE